MSRESGRVVPPHLRWPIDGVYLYAPSGSVYRFGYDLTPHDHAYPVPDIQGNVTYKVVHQ